MKYGMRVFYQRRNTRLHRRIKRWGMHPSVVAESEKEARLALIADYNKRGLRVIEIQRLTEEP